MTDDNSTPPPDTVEKRKPGMLRRLWPLALLLGVVAAVYFSGATDYLSYEALREHLSTLQGFVASHTALAFLALVVVYAIGTALSLPAMSVVTVASGLIYGLALGFAGVLLGAVIGATAIFVIVRTSLGDPLREKVRPWLGRFERGFQKDEFNYLLALRLVPVFPFWVLNIAPALLGMKLRNYVLSTALGIIPGTFVYVWVGKGAAQTIKLGGRVDPAALLFEPHIIGPLVGLALLSLLPVLLKRLRKAPAAEDGANS